VSPGQFNTISAVQVEVNGSLLVCGVKERAEKGGGGSEHLPICVEDGVSRVRALREDLRLIFSRPGNAHWGDMSDLKILCEHLDLGALVFADRLIGRGAECVHGLNVSRGDFAFFVSVWWSNEIHFRVGEMRCDLKETGDFHWRRDALPDDLVRLYNQANRNAPLGSKPVVEVS